jgi:anti-sigma B factor antagonist
MNPDARHRTVSPLVVPEIVTFPAEVDITNSARLGGDLITAFRPGVSVVIADMSRTAFCDSSGIRHLLIANDRASKNLAQLRVVVAAEQVLRVLRVTGVDEVLDLYPSLQKALADRPPLRP